MKKKKPIRRHFYHPDFTYNTDVLTFRDSVFSFKKNKHSINYCINMMKTLYLKLEVM